MVSNQNAPGISIDPMRLAARWRSEAEWNKAVEELDAEPEPSHLNTLNSSGLFHIVSLDKMSVQYVVSQQHGHDVGAGQSEMSVQYVVSQQHGHDVGAVQADCPAPAKRIAYYFEMTVKDAGLKGQTAIGFTAEHFNLRRQPGWEVNSCGYRGDDGFLYLGQGKGESFGPTFTSGDTVGAGINYASQEFFFTKNGQLVGAVAKYIKGPLYPTVAVHSQNEEVTVNFGKLPFLFDIEAFMHEERLKQQIAVEKLSLQPDVCHWIVRSYLLHYGYEDTVTSFDNASDIKPSVIQENGFGEHLNMYALNNRKVLRQLIRNGDIDSAFQKLREWYPQVVQDENSGVSFLLHSQRFIEYIRVGDVEDAVNYGRAELAKFLTITSFENLLKDIVALLAYKEPLESCLGYLLEPPQREFVADAVNAAVLSTNPGLKDPESSMLSCLEKLLCQLMACSVERRSYEGQGETFYLHRELQSWKGKTQLRRP